MEIPKKSLSIKNKILIVLASLPVLSISLIVATATTVFKEDKLAYVFDTALSSTRAKANTLDSQISGFTQSLKALQANYDPDLKRLSFAGKKYFDAEPNIKAFYNFQWDGKRFLTHYKKAGDGVDLDDSELEEMDDLLKEAWYEGFSVGVSKQRPMHMYIAARIGEDGGGEIAAIMVETSQSFSLFGKGPRGENYLYHPLRGRLAGGDSQLGLDQFLANQVFNQKSRDATKEVELGKEKYLASYSRLEAGKLFVVSTINKDRALVAVRKLMARSFAFGLFILSVVGIIGVFASNGLTSALRGLAEATSKVMDGDFTVRVETKNDDEIGSLAMSFNKMTEEVSRLMEKTAQNARMEAELKTAQTVQETLFPPSSAQIGPVQIYGKMEPASECGGDWWYYCQIDKKVWVWIGDATGHGVPAALLTSAARAVASVIEKIPDMTPSRALEVMNRAIYSTSKGEMMMTFFLGCIDLDKNTFTYANASHDPPFYLNNEITGKPKRKDYFPLMEINNPRLGESDGTQYKEYSMPIAMGDKIIFYTDGIMDVKDPKGDIWGERRFLKSLSRINETNIESTVVDVFDDLNNFRQDIPLDDDVTLIVVELEKGKAA
ncbi:MAG: SpoIIE family protein phosphatase [Bdellovibrionales bacterium]|nr:SpoIIE family protein phosphatase [Bdellovibrionales bacterium]